MNAAERTFELGMSPCPNDTFMFHALVHGLVGAGDLRFSPVLLDIEALNERALGPSPLPVTKLSVAASFHASDRYVALASGAALGRGCGPLVVRRGDRSELRGLADLEGRKVAIPGELTTAHLLLRVLCAGFEVVAMRFDRIMPAVAEGRVDAGLIIHESRFTYPEHGLEALADLGDLWEAQTGLPIPLGLIAVARTVSEADARTIESALRDSIVAARRDPSPAWPWIRAHAQEMDEQVCQKHIELYVNEFSVDLGDEGRSAVLALFERAKHSGIVPADAPAPLLSQALA